jgi:hypothetical protein
MAAAVIGLVANRRIWMISKSREALRIFRLRWSRLLTIHCQLGSRIAFPIELKINTVLEIDLELDSG